MSQNQLIEERSTINPNLDKKVRNFMVVKRNAKIWGETYKSEDSGWFDMVIAEIDQRERERVATLCLERSN